MKHLLGIGLISLMGLQAYGQESAPAAAPAAPTPTSKTEIRLRFDSLSQQTDDTVGTAAKTTTKTSGFRLKRSDITFTNKIGDATVQLRILPLGPSWSPDTTVVGTGNGLSSVLDQFWIEMPLFTDALKLKAGKLDYYLVGSIEYIQDTSFEFFLGSYFFNNIAPANDPLGVSLAYTMGKQKFELQVNNGMESESALTQNGANATNKSYDTNGGISVAVGYYGDFGWVLPVVTYSKIRYAQSQYVLNDAAGDKETHDHKGSGLDVIGLGAEFNLPGGAYLAAEYDMSTVAAYDFVYVPASGVTVSGESDKVTLDTMVLNFKYPVGAFTPFVKVTADTEKVASKNAFTQTGFSVGSWYNLPKTSNGRLFVAYNNITYDQKDTSPAGIKDKIVTTEWVVGTALKI